MDNNTNIRNRVVHVDNKQHTHQYTKMVHKMSSCMAAQLVEC